MPEPTTPTSASSGAPATTTSASHEPRVIEVTRQEKNSLVMRLVGEHGSETQALMAIAGKQIRYQKRAQEAERQSAELRKLVPASDAVVLTGDEAKAIQKLREAKVDLVKLPDTVKDATDLRSKVTAQERTTALTKAAEDDEGKPKYKLAVLSKLLGETPVEFKDTMVKKEDNTTATVSRPYVKNAQGVLEPLDAYLEREHKDWMDVARATEGDSSSTTSGTTSQQTGGTMPRQTSTNGGSSTAPKLKENTAIVDRQMSKYKTPGQIAAEQQRKT